MSSCTAFHRVSGTLFGLIAVAHALRAFFELPVATGGFAIPQWWSWAVVVATGLLSVWAFVTAPRR